MFEKGDRVIVTGPPGSAWVGQAGEVLSVTEGGVVVVILNPAPGRPRGFRSDDLRRED